MELLPMFDASYKGNPFPFYAELRQSSPLVQVMTPMGLPVWIATTYEAAKFVLTDSRLSRDPANQGPEWRALREMLGKDRPAPSLMRHHMAHADPPRHAALRKPVADYLTPDYVRSFEHRLVDICDEALRPLRGRSTIDVVADYAYVVAKATVSELLGVTDGPETEEFERQARLIAAGLSTLEDAGAALASVLQYIARMVAEARDDSHAEGLLAELARAPDLSEQELMDSAFLMVGSSAQNSIPTMSIAVYQMLADGSTGRIARDEDGWTDQFVEEVLRWQGPLELTSHRYALCDFEAFGAEVKEKDPVLVGLLSANRDESVFESPDEFIVDRPKCPHLSFGHGIHRCPGARLARAQATIAIKRFAEAFPDASVVGAPEDQRWTVGMLWHGLVELPVNTGV